MSGKVLALNDRGELTYCSVPPEMRGRGRCNHIDHQRPGESTNEFIERIDSNIHIDTDECKVENITEENIQYDMSQKEVDKFAAQIDQIAGCKVTPENLNEVLEKLNPEQIRQITKIGFDSAPSFSIPITEEGRYQAQVENNIYFADLPKRGVAGKQTVMDQMFDSIGIVPGAFGQDTNIEGNFKDGLTDDEYFEKLYSARGSMISKTVAVALPGYTARKLFYGLSDVHVKEDCGNESSDGILHCHVPGGICAKCAAKSGWQVKVGELVGATVSTNASEPLTQLSMRSFHTGGKNLKEEQKRNIINNTFDAFSSSPVIEEARKAGTTEERRRIIYEGLKHEYETNGIKMDDYNLMLIAKKMTSYKRVPGKGMHLVKEGELCDISSVSSIGNHNNPFKAAELGSPYKHITNSVGEYDLPPDAASELIFGDGE